MSIAGYSGPINEDSPLTLSCDITPGNPKTFTTTKYWHLVPKYEGTESQALPGQAGQTELSVERTVYSDAGTYRCTVGNEVGSDTDELEVVVHCEYYLKYPPDVAKMYVATAF